MNVNERVRRQGDVDLKELFSEFGQIYKYDMFEALDIDSRSMEIKKEALNLMTMIKDKRCVKIKVRACADGRIQRRYIDENEVVSPTMQLDSLIISLMTDNKRWYRCSHG